MLEIDDDGIVRFFRIQREIDSTNEFFVCANRPKGLPFGYHGAGCDRDLLDFRISTEGAQHERKNDKQGASHQHSPRQPKLTIIYRIHESQTVRVPASSQ